ncbi:MAG: hypothetical protein ACKER6_01070 [Candidatus Hodgkinia cicadicola]
MFGRLFDAKFLTPSVGSWCNHAPMIGVWTTDEAVSRTINYL